MNRFIILVLALLVPQLAAARVYMCVDEATGATSFTDKACETAGTVEEIKVNRVNLDSGTNTARRGRGKSWRSQTDSRRTGEDFNEERRSLYEGKATASAR